MNDGVTVWCPETLDVHTLLASGGQRIAEGVLWLGHCVFTRLAGDVRCRDAGRVTLRADYLRHVIGRHHLAAVRAAATQAGYVARDRSYRAGERAQAYWILAPHDTARLIRWPITDRGLCHRVATWLESRRRELWQRIKRNETPVAAAVCEHLWRNLLRVRIDAEVGADNFPRELVGPVQHNTVHHMVGSPAVIVSSTYQVAAGHLRDAEFWFTVDDFGRIHTNLTNLPRMLRPYLSVDGERLANIDISESQPLFVGLSLATAQQANGRQNQTSHGKGHHMMDVLMMDKDRYPAGQLDRGRLPADLRRYLELCEARRLYATVASRLGKSRDEAKRGVMVVFFDKPWHKNAVSNVLWQLFPTVMDAMRAVKTPDFRQLAHSAQRIESAFMFGRVLPSIMQRRPELFVSTIHDSILTTAKDAEIVREVMLNEFARLGVTPQVRIESFDGTVASTCRPDHATPGCPRTHAAQQA